MTILFSFFEWVALTVPPIAVFFAFALLALGQVARYQYCDHLAVRNGRYRFGSLMFGVGALVFGSNYLWIQLGATPTLVQSGIFRFTAGWMALSGIHMNAGAFEVAFLRGREKVKATIKGKATRWRTSIQ